MRESRPAPGADWIYAWLRALSLRVSLRGSGGGGVESIFPQLLSLGLSALLQLVSFGFRPLLLVLLLVIHSVIVGLIGHRLHALLSSFGV
jgi:hypothetical protein